NLDKISDKLKDVYLRREKENVNQHLPETVKVILPIPLNDSLKEEQYLLCDHILQLFNKKTTNPYDLIQLKSYLNHLIDLGKYTSSALSQLTTSPKLTEFRHFIRHKLVLNKKEPIVIFIEGVKHQQQVKKILEKENKAVEIIKESETVFNENIQFFITSEQLQNELPLAQHFIYFHFPSGPNAINERVKILNNRNLGISQNKIYLFQTPNSLESVLYQWQDSKPNLSQQLSDYLLCKDISKVMDLRLGEELNHEIKTLFALSKPIISKTPSPQMDLFGEAVVTHKQQKNMTVTDNALVLFFNNMMNYHSAYNKLNSKQKELILNGNIEVNEEKDEIVIRIKSSLKSKV
ncbi:MAG: hypothetical protein KAH25_03990, partial [Bacteroidales bacterium]|nr:hypothetical protein [Bacteroidales bacterium]